MAVFAVFATINSPSLKAAIIKQYGANHYEFAANAWFVPDSGTTAEVANKIGLSTGNNDVQGVVVKIAAYSGRSAATAWTWLQGYPEAISNG